MKLYKVLFYFLTEALRGLLRSWRISAVAVVTLSVSLFLCGAFLLVTQNLSSAVEGWREGVRVVVFLDSATADEAAVVALRARLGSPEWVDSVEEVSPEEAVVRFREAFPSLVGVVEGWEQSPFPSSFEVVVDPMVIERPGFTGWLEELRGLPGVEMVDGDQEWLSELAGFLRVISLAGLAIGSLFLVAAALTGASIMRLVAHLHREEIAIMRLVGATEFFVRGPFYVEGLLQGLAGGLTAALGLRMLVAAIQRADGLLWAAMLFSRPLEASAVALLVGAGGLTGLVGALVSIRANSLGTDLVT